MRWEHRLLRRIVEVSSQEADSWSLWGSDQDLSFLTMIGPPSFNVQDQAYSSCIRH